MSKSGPRHNEHMPGETAPGDILLNLGRRRGIHLIKASTPVPVLKVNVYFVERPVPTLIDVPSVTPSSLAELDRGLRRLGYCVEDIEVIIVTHPHVDHFGLAGDIAQKSGAEIWATGSTADWIGNFDDECREEEQFLTVSLKRAGVPAGVMDDVMEFFQSLKAFAGTAMAGRRLVPGEVIELASGDFRVEHVPGHTPWCIMLVDAAEGMGFSGDFLLKDISPNPLIQRPWKVPDGYRSLEAYVLSLKRVAGMDLKLILPGHGELIENPGQRIEDLFGFIDARARQIKETLSRKPALTVFEIVSEIFPQLPGNQVFLAVSEVFAHLETLESKGAVICPDGDFPPRFTLSR